jgi:hypothetical protein
MPRRPTASPAQLSLSLDRDRNRPPVAPPTPDLLQVLAELLLDAVTATTGGAPSREVGDEPQDRR